LGARAGTNSGPAAGVNAKTAGNPAKQTASGGTVCIAQYHKNFIFLNHYSYCAIHSLPGFPLFLQRAGIALFVLDFWYFSSGKSTERKE
jgi:hypothetical protein